MPRPLLLVVALLIAISLLPAAYLAKARVSNSRQTRLQIVYSMDTQPKAKTQTASRLFVDGRSMRPPVEGTVARGELGADSLLYHGRVEGSWANEVPRVAGGSAGIDLAFLERGRERFGIYCSPCHGTAGRGDGLVSQRAVALAEGTWTPPSDLTGEVVAARADGEIFDFITHGVRKMPSYGKHLSPRDRWAVVLYLRALQRSVRGTLEDVPEDERAALGGSE